MTTAVAERTQETLPDAASRDYRWTADRFYRAASAGVFDDPGRIELLHGRLVQKMPYSSRHIALVGHIAKRLRATLEMSVTVRTEAAIRIAFDGEPIPDVSVVRGDDLDYLSHHATPEDVFLLVEVAVSSEQSDLGEKSLLYAQAGIGDYWVVLPEREQIAVHREPSPDGYRAVTALEMSDTLSPLAAESVTLSVRDLLGLQGTEGRTEQP